MTHPEFQQIAPSIPHQPGIYKYFDAGDELLYVGKAKDLRKRVASYFTKTFVSYKTVELVKRIFRIEFTVTNSEQDAFFLENSLIKQFQPKYNIDLKDDKTYPWIVIKKEAFPRVFLTRKKINDGSEYLGPFTSVGKVRELIGLIRNQIPLRTCKLPLTEANIKKGKFKVCLEYHLGNCKGPCAGLQTTDDYTEGLQQVKNLLRGNLAPVIQLFKKNMQEAAAGMAFEKAEIWRQKIDYLQNYSARSAVVSNTVGDADVFSINKKEDTALVNYLMVRNGAIVQTHTSVFNTHFEETEAEILPYAITELRQLFYSDAQELVVPVAIEYLSPGIIITVPKSGDKKKLLDLSLKNAAYAQADMEQRKRLHLGEGPAKMDVLEELMEDLQLSELPDHIECFDNSNFQGSYPVSAMVCFKNGVASKKDYRHYNVKTVSGINDFATMKEVVLRRYKRLLDEQQPLPQLVIIDGGKGQLSAALESIHELGLDGSMTLVGLAKNVEEIFFAGDQESLKLPYNSNSLKLIRQIRDEVHRFGITFHRQKRSKGTFKNELEEIKGIGKATADLLLQTFKSVKNVQQQNETGLESLIGKAKTKLLLRHFSNK